MDVLMTMEASQRKTSVLSHHNRYAVLTHNYQFLQMEREKSIANTIEANNNENAKALGKRV